MDDRTTAFEAQRGLLFAIAYRMLGTVQEAEDAVQDAWLRWHSAEAAEVVSPKAFLTTVVTRLCVDRLRSARARRETYVGPWLPEPSAAHDPLDLESLSFAVLVLLETLSPLERAVYVLHQVLDYSHAEIADLMGKTPEAVRQALHRAREHVRARRPRFAPSREAHARVLASFVQAVTAGDEATLRSLLTDDVVAVGDGGGVVPGAGRKPIRGVDNVTRLFLALGRQAAGLEARFVDLNGWPSLVLVRDGAALLSMSIETDGDRIFGVYDVVNPAKLARLPV